MALKPWLAAAQAKVGRAARVEGGWAVDVEHRHASGLIEATCLSKRCVCNRDWVPRAVHSKIPQHVNRVARIEQARNWLVQR